MSKLNTYYRLTKPGIIYGNAITAIGGYFLAAGGGFDVIQFAAMLIGLSLIIASACVFNNYLDRDIDAKMKRTSRRALPAGQVSGRNALIYASSLGLIGSLLLSLTNWLALGMGLFGLVAYVVFYGLAKRHTIYGTEVGSISGAMPIVVGYTAASGQFDLGAWLLFAIMVVWQMPHFYAIAIFRRQDYAAAGLPIISVIKGVETTKRRNLGYTVIFLLAAVSLSLAGYTGFVYLAAMLLLGAWWLRLAAGGLTADNDEQWARRVFGASLSILLIFSLLISLDALLV